MNEFGTVCQARDSPIAIEVGTQSHMVDAHHLDGMLEVGDDVDDRRLTVLAQETVIDGGLRHATLGGEGPHLVVGEVARMVAEGTGRGVAAHDGFLADVEGIVETLLARMAHVDEDAQTVHLPDDLFAKGADSSMGVLCLRGRVADVIVAVVAEGHIDDATIGKVLQVLDLAVEGDAVLDAQHDRLAALALVLPEVGRGACNPHIVAVLLGDGLYLVEDIVGKGLGLFCGLGQVGHHDGRIETPLRHLVQIGEDTRVALDEADALGKEHRGVAMGVEGEDAVVQLMGLTIIAGFLHQPPEQGQAALHALRMPLNAQYRLELAALHGLDDAIGGCRHDTELFSRVADGLMVEGVDEH